MDLSRDLQQGFKPPKFGLFILFWVHVLSTRMTTLLDFTDQSKSLLCPLRRVSFLISNFYRQLLAFKEQTCSCLNLKPLTFFSYKLRLFDVGTKFTPSLYYLTLMNFRF